MLLLYLQIIGNYGGGVTAQCLSKWLHRHYDVWSYQPFIMPYLHRLHVVVDIAMEQLISVCNLEKIVSETPHFEIRAPSGSSQGFEIAPPNGN